MTCALVNHAIAEDLDVAAHWVADNGPGRGVLLEAKARFNLSFADLAEVCRRAQQIRQAERSE